jgi:hypothetical protein
MKVLVVSFHPSGKLRVRPRPSEFFPIHYSPIILPLDAVWSTEKPRFNVSWPRPQFCLLRYCTGRQ